MSMSTTILVLDPVDPHELFAAALEVVGNPPLRHQQDDGGGMRMLFAEGYQGAPAKVSVHFPAAGGPYREEPDPEGYAAVLLTNNSDDDIRARHEHLVRQLAPWLNAHGLRWQWEFEGEGWHAGS